MDYESKNKELIHEYRVSNDNNILGRLYELNKGLFHKIILKYKGLDEIEDLMQECYYALVKAVNSYNDECGDFSKYLSVVTSSHLFRYAQKCGAVYIPEYMQKMIIRYRRLKSNNISDECICREMNILPEMLESIKQAVVMRNIYSLDEPINDDDMTTRGDTIPDQIEPQEQIIDQVFNEELSRAIYKSSDDLTEREKDYLFKRYYDDLTYKEIDSDHSETNTRRIIDKALRKLRRNDDLRKYYQETNFTSFTGLSYFRHAQTSSVERLVMLFNDPED